MFIVFYLFIPIKCRLLFITTVEAFTILVAEMFFTLISLRL